MDSTSTVVSDFASYGRDQSESCKGGIEAYRTFLSKFHSGNIVKEGDLRRNSDEEKQRIQDQIDDLEASIVSLKGEINRRSNSVNGLVHTYETEIHQKEKEIRDIQVKSADSKKYEVFRLSKYITYFIFLIPLSVYLVFFYTAISHSVFYGLNPESLIQGNTLSIPILPDFQDLTNALRTNYMLIVVPSVFFSFGLALHILLESESKYKALQIAGIISITLLADIFMAYKIHEQAILALTFVMDESEISTFIERIWYKDINFFIVLILGFVVFLIWAIIFHATQTEWSKRDVIKSRMNQIDKLRSLIALAKKEVTDFENQIAKNQSKVDSLQQKKERESVSIKRLQHNIDEFTSGWIEYLTYKYRDEQDKYVKEVNEVKNEFMMSISEK